MLDLIIKLIDKLNCISNTKRIEILENRIDYLDNHMYTKEWIDKLQENIQDKHVIEMTNLNKTLYEMSAHLKDNHNALMKKYEESDKRITGNAIKLSGIETAINLMTHSNPIASSKKTTWRP
jgi:uncharacterized protein YeeX (DUF496 family)